LQFSPHPAQSAPLGLTLDGILATHGSGLRAENVSITRGERCLFEGLNFALEAGQLALLVGPNGAGKTSLLRVLAGLAEPSAGSVTWAGHAVSALPVEARGAIAYRGHLDGLKMDLTVGENLAFHAAIWNRPCELDVLRELELEGAIATRVRRLSAGQRRRAALATLRVISASLWILDEPMTNLDVDGRATILAWTRRHLEGGGSAVVATHQPDEFARPGAFVVEL
jgi:heme exporter protein A